MDLLRQDIHDPKAQDAGACGSQYRPAIRPRRRSPRVSIRASMRRIMIVMTPRRPSANPCFNALETSSLMMSPIGTDRSMSIGISSTSMLDRHRVGAHAERAQELVHEIAYVVRIAAPRPGPVW